MLLPLTPVESSNVAIFELHAEFESDDIQAVQKGSDLYVYFETQASVEEIESVTEKAYRSALTNALDLDYFHLVRAWNVVPEINSHFDGIENYQRFCSARKKVFTEFGYSTKMYPAASAIGSKSDRIFFGFKFSEVEPTFVSNPFQVEAFHYPTQYGPTSPSFARAAIHGTRLYLSGTASIRGHETLYAGELESQLSLTLENIEAVVNSANQKSATQFSPSKMNYRVYLRKPEFHKTASLFLRERLGAHATFNFLEADICRSNLLVEIEGVANGI